MRLFFFVAVGVGRGWVLKDVILIAQDARLHQRGGPLLFIGGELVHSLLR